MQGTELQTWKRVQSSEEVYFLKSKLNHYLDSLNCSQHESFGKANMKLIFI